MSLEDFNTETEYINEDLADLTEPLEEIEETEDYYTEEPETETEEDYNTDEEIKENSKRSERLSKLGAKGITKMLDLGNANLCRKIAYSDTAEPYRADPEALEDLTEVLEEIIPKKPGKGLNIPLWLQLIIFILLAFLPTIIAAWTDRADNKEKKAMKEELKAIKREKKKLKKKMEKLKLEKELAEAVKEEASEKEKIEILTGQKEEETEEETEKETEKEK